MVDNSRIAAQLKKLGYIVSVEWQKKVTAWREWYEGYVPDFHDADQLGPDGSKNDIKISSLNMAKTVCEDWASLLLGETTTITAEDEASNVYLQGVADDQMQGGLFGRVNFWQAANELIEKSFALGFGAMVPRLREAVINGAGSVISGAVGVDFITADHIIPLKWENRVITECAFVSERAEAAGKIVILQIHKAGSVEFHFYRANTDGAALDLVEVPAPDGYAEAITFKDKALFLPVFVRPQVNNNIDETTPFGVSVYASAIDVLKGCDLAYDNFNSDLELGRKMVVMRDDLFARDDDGKLIAPQKTRRRLFQTIPGGVPDPGKDDFFKEYNPSLRVAENAAAVQAQLNYLSFKCGMGAKHYIFDGGSIATATQVISENSELFRNRQKHNTGVEKSLIDLCRNVLRLAAEIGEAVKPETALTVSFDDSIIIDKESERLRFMQEIRDGIRQKWEYRVAYLGEDETKAKANVAQEAAAFGGIFGGAGGEA